MREIKFRAWDVEHKRWLIKGELENVGHYRYGQIVPNELVLQDEQNEKIFLMQYTGLKDKNGKEIYEGDVLKWDTTGSGDENIFSAVTFDHGEFRTDEEPLSWTNEETEVIGNVWENPELLKP